MDRDGDGEDNTERHETIHNGKKFWWDSFFFFHWLYKYSAVYKYMEDHIEKICKTYHFHLTNISKMRTYLDRESTEAIISHIGRLTSTKKGAADRRYCSQVVNQIRYCSLVLKRCGLNL